MRMKVGAAVLLLRLRLSLYFSSFAAFLISNYAEHAPRSWKSPTYIECDCLKKINHGEKEKHAVTAATGRISKFLCVIA